MTRTRSGALALAILTTFAASSLALAQRAPTPGAHPTAAPSPAEAARATRVEIRQTYGFIPRFIQAIPDAMLPAFWMMEKDLEESPHTALDAKTKALIGLAVAAQVPCEYCVYFDTMAARQAGATDQEIAEATAMAGLTRMTSTILNGMQVDRDQFRKDVQRMMRRERQQARADAPPHR